MPSLSEIPDGINRTKFLKALGRLGFKVNTIGGKGSHVKVEYKNGKTITVPDKIHKQTLYYILKEIESYSGVTWD
ncbi:hypothetical protein COT78_03545 [Candidatus Berkelbacteria bacterium CG10_big_fil_rev_8_21_14_0_10_43_13]|uniref:Type II toxin-antitoxin system HicA family toxin n=1 Tax=Candidatus Berkelbacteria bacterium CG10_big_fil_rev_8_21_14_0_10_43_13 TaxID=1974514 RepID=A0A2H0W5V0_9BACT|nr:MAG: hypothetical protein COT78_03545 [Candidatus Berkelbacteria bacterium CG10_big_fil_rev_8_21_14_0_10_43_13]